MILWNWGGKEKKKVLLCIVHIHSMVVLESFPNSKIICIEGAQTPYRIKAKTSQLFPKMLERSASMSWKTSQLKEPLLNGIMWVVESNSELLSCEYQTLKMITMQLFRIAHWLEHYVIYARWSIILQMKHHQKFQRPGGGGSFPWKTQILWGNVHISKEEGKHLICVGTLSQSQLSHQHIEIWS